MTEHQLPECQDRGDVRGDMHLCPLRGVKPDMERPLENEFLARSVRKARSVALLFACRVSQSVPNHKLSSQCLLWYTCPRQSPTHEAAIDAIVCMQRRQFNAPKGLGAIRSHPANRCFTHVLLEALIQMFPPLEEHSVADKLEPRGEPERGVMEQLLQSICSNVFSVLDFVRVRLEVDIGFDEENVIDCSRDTG